MARKTIEVEVIKDMVNNLMATSTEQTLFSQTVRSANATLLEAILHKTDNYKGFRYLDVLQYREDGEAIIPDETRRFYF